MIGDGAVDIRLLHLSQRFFPGKIAEINARTLYQQHHRQSYVGAAGSAIPARAHRLSRRVRESGDRARHAIGGRSSHMVAIAETGRKGTSVSNPQASELGANRSLAGWACLQRIPLNSKGELCLLNYCRSSETGR